MPPFLSTWQPSGLTAERPDSSQQCTRNLMAVVPPQVRLQMVDVAELARRVKKV
jgi:hypothetical protein